MKKNTNKGKNSNGLKKIAKIVIIIGFIIIILELVTMYAMHLIRESKVTYIDTLYNIKNINNDYYLAVGGSNFKHSKYNDMSTFTYIDKEGKENKVYAEKAKLVKYDKELNTIFEKSFKSDYNSIFYDATVKDNSIYVVGCYIYDEKQINLKTTDGLLVKYDLDGNFIWSKNFQILGDTKFKKIIVEDDGLIVVGQSIYENMEVGNHDLGGGIIIKYDFEGNIIWKNNFGGNKSGIFNDIVRVSDGYIVCGKDAVNYGLIVKFSLDGQRLWVKNYANTDDIGMSSLKIKDDKIDIASAINVSDETTSEGKAIFEYNACIFVYDLNGELLNTYTIGGNKKDRFNSLLMLDNSIIAIGYTESSNIDINDLNYKKDKTEGIIVEFDYEGKIINKKTYSGSKNEDLTGITESILNTEDKINNTKSYIVVGYTNSKRSLFKGNNKDYFSKVIKYNQKLEITKEQ